jgi:hypothetical protein
VKDDGVARNLTGYTATLDVFATPYDVDPDLSLTVGNGITIDPAGTIRFDLTEAQIAAFNFISGRYVLSVLDADTNEVFRLKGAIIVEES